MFLDAKDYSLPISEVLEQCPEIKKWVNSDNKIDLGNSEALYQYNKHLFKLLDGIQLDLDIKQTENRNLIPTAGLRRAIVSTIISNINPHSVIEIGTGASAIMALLFAKRKVKVIATEINVLSFQSAQKQIQLNNISHLVTLIKSEGAILDYLEGYFPVDCVLSLPPYYAADTKSLPKSSKGFQGTNSELYSFGEDIDFSLELFRQWDKINSSKYLIILWKNQLAVEKALVKINSLSVKNQIIEIKAGTRNRYLTITKKL